MPTDNIVRMIHSKTPELSGHVGERQTSDGDHRQT